MVSIDTPKAPRLKLAREHAGFPSAKEAAQAFGWVYSTYKVHESGFRGFKNDTAARYARAFNVPVEWLLTGINAPAWHASEGASVLSVIPTRYVAFVPLAELASVVFNDKMMSAGGRVVAVDAEPGLGPRCFATALEDDSMQGTGSPSFAPGDVCIFDPDRSIAPGDYVIAAIDGEPLPLFRQYRRRADARFPHAADLVPLNLSYETRRVHVGEDVTILGRLVRHTKKF